MAFGLTPVTGFPPVTPDEFPNFIQFRADGTNLGGPDADVVDFVYPLVATRGTGENENVVTVTTAENPSAVPAGSIDVMAFTLTGSGSGAWTFASLLADADVGSWNDGTDVLTFASAGVYQVQVASRLTLATNLATYASVFSFVGSGTDSLRTGSRHGVDSGTQEQFDFVDVFLLSMLDGDLQRDFRVSTDNGEQSVAAVLSVIITKLS